jgi:hypothetical protein
MLADLVVADRKSIASYVYMPAAAREHLRCAASTGFVPPSSEILGVSARGAQRCDAAQRRDSRGRQQVDGRVLRVAGSIAKGPSEKATRFGQSARSL